MPDPRPSPHTRHRGPVDGGPLHRKIRPPGASRRRATDIHVTLLPYRYTSRVVTTPRSQRTTTVIPARCADERNEKKSVGERERERDRANGGWRWRAERRSGEIILYFSYEPVRYVSSSVRQQCRVCAVDNAVCRAKRLPPYRPADSTAARRYIDSRLRGDSIFAVQRSRAYRESVNPALYFSFHPIQTFLRTKPTLALSTR